MASSLKELLLLSLPQPSSSLSSQAALLAASPIKSLPLWSKRIAVSKISSSELLLRLAVAPHSEDKDCAPLWLALLLPALSLCASSLLGGKVKPKKVPPSNVCWT